MYCKVSGIITEADWTNWSAVDIYPYLDVVVSTFGTNRLVFGSDWPVCLVAGEYSRMLQLVVKYFDAFSTTEKAAIFGGNAQRFYNLQ